MGQLLERLLFLSQLLLLHECFHALDAANNVLSVDLGINLQWLELLILLCGPILLIPILGVSILASSHLGVEVEALVTRRGLLTCGVIRQSGRLEGHLLVLFPLLLFKLLLKLSRCFLTTDLVLSIELLSDAQAFKGILLSSLESYLV